MEKKNHWKNWVIYTLIIAFATYWFANLLLWYPWSYDTSLGMTLMFVAISPIWIYAVYHCLKRYPGERQLRGALHISMIFIVVAVLLDYVFYGIIRDAMTELYHSTTLYGYAFLVALPYVEMYLFKKRLQQKKEMNKDVLFKFGLVGLISFIGIICIVLFNLTLSDGMFKFLTLIIASLIIFNMVLGMVLGSQAFQIHLNRIILLTVLCVIIGMCIGKFGANWGLPWWIYYPVPMFMGLLLPPILLKMNRKQVAVYLLLSFLSAPFIHVVFSFLFNWTEYMPFWEVPYFKSLLN